ncbi:hypothetical protein AGMMS49992_24370 [Clostridia bacterium]|nr:hypothetical protein AGMMS49992_24370 [Clostridia bacterium]
MINVFSKTVNGGDAMPADTYTLRIDDDTQDLVFDDNGELEYPVQPSYAGIAP